MIKGYRERFLRWAKQVEAKTDNAWLWLEAYFGIYADILKGNGDSIFSNGVFSAKFETLPENMQREIRIMLRGGLAGGSDFVREPGLPGEWFWPFAQLSCAPTVPHDASGYRVNHVKARNSLI